MNEVDNISGVAGDMSGDIVSGFIVVAVESGGFSYMRARDAAFAVTFVTALCSGAYYAGKFRSG